MRDYLALLQAVLPVLGIVAAGFAMRRLDWLTEEADASLMRVVINLLTPCLIADTLLGNPAFDRVGNVILPPVLGCATTIGGILIAWGMGRWLKPECDERSRRTFAVTVGICNYGYIPLPLAQLLFTHATVGVLFVQNIGVELGMWLAGLAVLGGHSWRSGWRHLATPPVFAILGTLVLNLVARREQVPLPLLQAAGLLGQCAIPLGLILVGATVADLLSELRTRGGWRVVILACLLRLLLFPALMLALAWAIPVSREIREVMVLHAAMPAAVFPILMARYYGGNPGTAVRVVVATSLAGALTIPIWLKVGMTVLGLEAGAPGEGG